MSLQLFAPGDVVAGKYRIEGVLAEGSTAIVLVATHLGLGATAVLKVLHPQFARDADSVQRFTREARAVARLHSEHVVRIFDVDMLFGGTPYMVMEHLEGIDLAGLVRRGPMPFADAVDMVIQACSGVAAAHAAGVVHRDLKPANLFCTTTVDGARCIKVLDFGVSKFTAAFDALTAATPERSSEVLGTPAYMAPEQLGLPASVDERADVWALGAILYELLVGRRAFPGATVAQVLTSITHDTPLPLGQGVPLEFEAIVARCLEKRPEDRFPSVCALAAALAEFADSGEVTPSSRRPVFILAKAPAPSLPVIFSAPLLPPTKRASAAGWVVAALATCGLGALTLVHTTSAEPAETSVTSAALAPPVLPPGATAHRAILAATNAGNAGTVNAGTVNAGTVNAGTVVTTTAAVSRSAAPADAPPAQPLPPPLYMPPLQVDLAPVQGPRAATRSMTETPAEYVPFGGRQ